MLSHVRANPDVWLGWTWWAAGPWWGNYQFTLEPTNNFTREQPAMGCLRPFLPLPIPALRATSQARLTFSTWPGFSFQPEYSDSLSPGLWLNYGSELAGNGRTLDLPLSPDNATRFFRVRVSLGP